ncbi:MAG: hypothetical protein SPH82_05120 [Eubacteriales bacterium]|nr:hypothetical protein [Eubacteriales bacterium]
MNNHFLRSAKPSFPGPNPGGTSKPNSNLYKQVAVFLYTTTMEFTSPIIVSARSCAYSVWRVSQEEKMEKIEINNSQMLISAAPRVKAGHNQEFNISQNQERNAALKRRRQHFHVRWGLRFN